MIRRAKIIPYLLLALAMLSPAGNARADENEKSHSACVPAGLWLYPGSAKTPTEFQLIDAMARRSVVLLGEAHTSAEHHRWQLHVLAALHARQPNMVIGFESFPRSVQPILDLWIRGALTEKEFLEKSRWNEVWRYDAKLYMPLFHFARMNRIPMRALNIERARLDPISDGGWDAAPDDLRQQIGDPATASKAYIANLKGVFDEHKNGNGENISKEDMESNDVAFARFVDVQLTWDRAMARELAAVRKAGGDPLVVAIAGRGHMEYGYGIPHQLDDLGIRNSAVLLPWDVELSCDLLRNTQGDVIADAVFGIDSPIEQDKPPRPMLGIQIEAVSENDVSGIRVIRVVDDSIAAKSGLKQGDLIVMAAGLAIGKTAELVAIIQRQAPGTWLPLNIRRGAHEQEIIAKFPSKPEKTAHP